MSRIVAADGPNRFLVELDSTHDVDGKAQGQVLDTRRQHAFPPMFIQSLLARGTWEPVTLDPDAERTIIASCQPIAPPAE